MSGLIGVGWAAVPLERITPTARIVTLRFVSMLLLVLAAAAGIVTR